MNRFWKGNILTQIGIKINPCWRILDAIVSQIIRSRKFSASIRFLFPNSLSLFLFSGVFSRNASPKGILRTFVSHPINQIHPERVPPIPHQTVQNGENLCFNINCLCRQRSIKLSVGFILRVPLPTNFRVLRQFPTTTFKHSFLTFF